MNPTMNAPAAGVQVAPQMMLTPQQQMIYDAFQSETYVSNRMDVQHTPLYDTIVAAAGTTLSATTSQWFTNVGSNSSKTLAQTNMSQSQKLPAPQAFSIFGIRLRWSENILEADVYGILNGFAVSLWLGDKRYQLAPIWYFGAGGGLYAVSNTTAATYFVNGLPTREAMHKLAIPIVIENQAPFYAQLEGNNYVLTAAGSGGTGATLTLLLDGLYARGVQ